MSDKPKFDPSQPYEPAPTAKPKFDPAQPYEAAAAAPKSTEKLGPTLGDLDSAAANADPGFFNNIGHQWLRGFFKGNSDELSGRAGSLFRTEKDDQGKPTSARDADVYRLLRDKERSTLSAGEKHRPWGSFLSNVGGDITSDLAASAFGVPILSAPYMTAVGALRGFGESTSDNLGGQALDTGIGAALGFGANRLPRLPAGVRSLGDMLEQTGPGRWIANSGAAQSFQRGASTLGDFAGRAAAPIGDAIESAARWPGDVLERFGARRALKAAGYIQKDMKPILVNQGQDALEQRGRDLLDNGVVRFARNAEDVAARAGVAKDAAGGAIGDALKAADASGASFDMMPFVRRAHTEILDPLKHDPAIRPDVAKVSALLDEYVAAAQKPGGITFSEANAMKRSLQDSINWNSTSANAQGLVKRLQHVLTDEIDNQVGGAAGPDALARLMDAKRLYSSMKPSAQIANEGIARNVGNRFFGMGVSEGAGTFGPLYFLAQGQPGRAAAVGGAALGAKLLKERGPSAMAVGSRGLANLYLDVVNNAPQLLGEFGSAIARQETPEAQLAATQTLAAASPKFAEMLDGLTRHLAARQSGSDPEAQRAH